MKTLHIIYWIVIIPLMVALVSFAERESREKRCDDFVVEVQYTGDDFLLTAEEVHEQVVKSMDSINGVPVTEIREAGIEAEIAKNPFVKQVKVYTTINGHCIAEVDQRKSIVKYIGKNGNSVYVDDTGILMPDRGSLPARVPVANGNFTLDVRNPETHQIGIEELQREDLDALFRVAKFINRDNTLFALVEQIYLNEEGEIELVTKLGEHSVLLGKAGELEEKFNKLKIFYNNAMVRGGWRQYKQLNLKFKNQVVCKKH
ncbi:MAG: hypothetical protein R6U19_00205 [Bacteroidales bacterium]